MYVYRGSSRDVILITMELRDSIFSVSNTHEFEQIALQVFEFQSKNCSVYKDYISHLKWPAPSCIKEIPFLPIDFFKTRKIIAEDITPAVGQQVSSAVNIL